MFAYIRESDWSDYLNGKEIEACRERNEEFIYETGLYQCQIIKGLDFYKKTILIKHI